MSVRRLGQILSRFSGAINCFSFQKKSVSVTLATETRKDKSPTLSHSLRETWVKRPHTQLATFTEFYKSGRAVLKDNSTCCLVLQLFKRFFLSSFSSPLSRDYQKIRKFRLFVLFMQTVSRDATITRKYIMTARQTSETNL